MSARKATLLNPTEDDETVQVLRRRLFERIDTTAAAGVIEEYRSLWHAQRDALSSDATEAETLCGFHDSYPLHPDVLETFTSKTATLANFQPVRGMLRILGRTVARLWELRPNDATAIHLHHIDPGYEPVRQEIVTQLGLSMYVPAIRSDIAGEQGRRALAQELDDEHMVSSSVERLRRGDAGVGFRVAAEAAAEARANAAPVCGTDRAAAGAEHAECIGDAGRARPVAGAPPAK